YSATPELLYSGTCSDYSWADEEQDGKTCGDIHSKVALTGVRMKSKTNGYSFAGIKYRVYNEGIGWSEWANDNEYRGHSSRKIKAIQAEIYDSVGSDNKSNGYSVYYRTYSTKRGWLGWASDGEESGDYEDDSSITGIQAVIVPKIKTRYAYIVNNHKATSLTYYAEFLQDASSKKPFVAIRTETCKDINKKSIEIISRNTYENNESVEFTSANSVRSSILMSTLEKPLRSFEIHFADVNARAKYSILHYALERDADKDSEWKKNTEESRDYSGNTICMAAVDVKPASYDRNTRKCVTKEFSPTQDGYSFVNSRSSFNYPEGYKIEKEKYVALFGDKLGTQIYKSETWGGSCFGMSIAAVFFRNGIYDIKRFTSGVDRNTDYCYGITDSASRVDSRLRDLIEYLMISQALLSEEHPSVASDKNRWDDREHDDFKITKDNPKALAETLMDNDTNRYIMYFSNHVVVPISINKKNSRLYEIKLYDPNMPGQEACAKVWKDDDIWRFEYGSYNAANLLDAVGFYNRRKKLYDLIYDNSINRMYASYLDLNEEYRKLLLADSNIEVIDDEGNRVQSVESYMQYDGMMSNRKHYNIMKGTYELSNRDNSSIATVIMPDGRNKTLKAGEKVKVTIE
ncbi:MAG: hypothetical protein K6G63_04060, partial [Eubacterium sp.]|nr:hypothetical protein [Eubacterium sp.]